MNMADIPGVGSLPMLLAYHINLLSDRHEAAWRAGRRPRIEDFLTLEAEPGRTVLLRELLAAELAVRWPGGETPDRQEYCDRFPGDTALIEAVFEEAEPIRDGPPTPGLKQPVATETCPPEGADRDPLADRGTPELPGAERTLETGETVRIPTHADPARPGGGPAGTGSSTVPFREAMGPSRRFRILRRHVRGGLGEVFVAFDEELRREVALKQIRPEHAGQERSQARFLLEAEITGGLEHPGIVPVYGLGRHADGRPYYAMRFVQGNTLQEAIAQFHGAGSPRRDPGERTLALRQLLRGLIDVCNALAYAHSRGVLHRDLKPANILLGPFGETLIVDWGLAKPMAGPDLAGSKSVAALRPSLAGDLALTQTGSALGSPGFMSPEQAAGQVDRVGPPSDVYSLGATLYCVLTGRAPIEERDIEKALQKAQAGDFAPPRQVQREVDGGLEAICLRAMALRPEDRYPSCRALADDLDRWMADEPISAWREPLARRARRWARRNRTAATAAAVALVAGVVGLAAVLAVQTRANGRLQQANTNLAQANLREQQRFNLAMEAIKLFQGEVGDDLVLKADQFKPLRDRLLRGAADFYGKLEGMLKGQSDRASRAAMGDAYFELGELTSKIGNRPAALAAHRKGLAIRRELASEAAGDDVVRGDLARSLSSISGLLDGTGNSAEALARAEEARDLLEGLPLSGPKSDGRRALLGSVYKQVGDVLRGTGKTAAAMLAYERSVETLTRLADDNPAVTEFRRRLAESHFGIGNLRLNTGKKAEALESYEKALAIQQKLADDNPAVTDFRSRLAASHTNIGIQQMFTGKPVEAMESYRRALAIRQKLADDNPAVNDFRSRLAISYTNIGVLQSNTGKPVEALESYRRALVIQQRLADDNPAVTVFRFLLADIFTNLGSLLVHNGRATEALAEFLREEAIRTKLVQDNPLAPHFRERLANCENNTATALLRLGRPAEARALCERAAELGGALVKDHPESVAYRAVLAESLLRSGLARRDEGDDASAAAAWRRAVAVLEEAREPDAQVTFLHACCHASLSGAAGRPGSGVTTNEVGAEAAKALTLLLRAAATGFRDPATYRNETALHPLRNRPDFRLLMMDLTFPAEPFAE